MSSFKLMPPEGTCTFRKIMHGRKWVGRVYQHADGTWRCAVYRQELGQGQTPKAAFETGIAKHLGYANIGELTDHNRLVRRRNRLAKQHARQVAHRLLQGDFSAIDALLGLPPRR